MEPKNPIIINGVDVSECKHITYKNSLNPTCGITCTRCRGRKNCYFKQLGRKEYECQRTEQKLILIRDLITDEQIYSSASSVCDKILKIIDEV